MYSATSLDIVHYRPVSQRSRSGNRPLGFITIGLNAFESVYCVVNRRRGSNHAGESRDVGGPCSWRRHVQNLSKRHTTYVYHGGASEGGGHGP